MNIATKVKEILSELSGKEIVEDSDRLQGFNIELDETDMNPFDLDTVQNVIDMVARYCGDENE